MISNTKLLLKVVCKTLIFAVIVIGLMPLPCNGQSDSVKHLKNSIRINVTNPMLFGSKYNVLGYERVVTDHQTFSVGIGRFALPKFRESDLDSLGLTDRYHDKGFHLSLDYRFYLKTENKYLAPRGIYLGPYYAFNYFNRELTWELNTSGFSGEVKSDVTLTTNLVGLQLGYQFVLWNRLSIDMILMGPGVWFFNLKTDFSNSLPPEDEALLLEEINAMLEEKFPGKDLAVTGNGFEASKTTSTKTMGFRYMINIGFRF
jgi:hypothetical protein